MIAIMPEWPEDNLIEKGIWRVIRIEKPHRDDASIPIKPIKVRNGFRSPPINPAKRVKSKRKKRR